METFIMIRIWVNASSLWAQTCVEYLQALDKASLPVFVTSEWFVDLNSEPWDVVAHLFVSKISNDIITNIVIGQNSDFIRNWVKGCYNISIGVFNDVAVKSYDQHHTLDELTPKQLATQLAEYYD